MEALRKNYFELFGLTQQFALDEASLQQAHIRLQQAVHPDRFAQASEVQKRMAVQLASHANQGFQVLKSPTRRAAYLCELAQVPLGLETNTSMPAEFLMEQMAWREALDDARGDPAGLAKIRATVQASWQKVLDALRLSFDERQDFAQAAGLTRQLVFIEKFLDDLAAS